MSELTHDDLCEIAVKFLQSNGFKVAFGDRFQSSNGTGEQPDAIGFRCGVSCLLEAKVSRSDFLADKKKHFRVDPDRGIGLLTYKEATEWEKRFQEPYYRALSKMSGNPYFGHVGGCPRLFAGITAKWVYGVALPDYVYESVKENKGDREKIHQYLKGDALLAVEKQMVAVTNIANSSVDYKDFDVRCMAAFDVKGQMQLLYPSAHGEQHASRLQ